MSWQSSVRLKNYSARDELPAYAISFTDITHTGAITEKAGTDSIDQSRIPIKLASGVKFVDTKDVLYWKAEGNYSVVYLEEEHFYVHLPLKIFLKQYPQFVRIHRSYAVALTRIKTIRKKSNGYFLFLDGGKSGHCLPVARRRLLHIKRLVMGPSGIHN